jgi:hypothetical protein
MIQTHDPRWDQILKRSWTCTSCGDVHNGLFDLGSAKPDPWQDPPIYLPNSAVTNSTHCLTEDFCVLDGQHYFVRCVLQLPLLGMQGKCFAFGVWSTLSKQNFDLYVENFDHGERDDIGPWFGWFSNRLELYPDTLNLKCRVHPQPGRQRPWIELEPTQHPLVKDSREGITYERLLEIYAAYGHSVSSNA